MLPVGWQSAVAEATIVLSRVGLSGHLSRPPGLHGGVR